MDIVHCCCGDKVYGCQFVLHIKTIKHKNKIKYNAYKNLLSLKIN
jgi:hypothetical protein